MLRIFFILFITLTNNIVSNSQNFGGGIILGVNTSQVGGDDLSGFHKAGPIVGIFSNKSINSQINLQFEMYYINKGSNNQDMNNDLHTNYLVPDMTLKYIETPLIIQYYFKNRLLLEGGITAAYLIDGYYNDLYGKINNQSNFPFKKYDVGLLIGVNYNYSEKISFNTRLSNSIFPIGQEDNSIFDGNNNYNSINKGKYNSLLSISIYYHII
tara:strand:+ start:190105 stop:190740 length:636 start_codon:yes stop_codon:yes gene_type:complete